MHWDRRKFLTGFVAGGGLVSRAAAQGDGPVTYRIVDAEAGRPVPARIRLLDDRGADVVPLGHPKELAPEAHEGDVRFQSRRYCYVDGEFRLPRNHPPVRYRILRGFEYGIEEGRLDPTAARDGVATIRLRRWTSLARRGWYSGDIHIHHIAPETCRLEMDAEDLNVANILTSDFTTDQDHFRGAPDPVSSGDRLVYVNQEFRNHELGHLCLLNLKRLVEPIKTVQPFHYPLHLQVCDEVHAQGGYVSWAHFPSWPGVENPLDVAMEKLDGLEILCVLEPRAFPIFMRQVVPEVESNDGLRLWYRYLNCGFRLTATAGTDKMTTFVTVGANRVYARLDGDFNYENWIRALRAGRTFITNSPIVFLEVNGAEPGAAVELDSARGRVVRIRATAESQLPYHRLEIVANGRVIAEASPSGPRHRAAIEIEHPVSESCWIAARALEDISRYRAAGLDFNTVHIAEGTLLSNYYGTRRPETVFAHTSPVYVLLDGAPIRSWEDAEYYVRYMDRAIRWLETEAKFAHPADKQTTLERFRAGRAVYERRAREARERQRAQARR